MINKLILGLFISLEMMAEVFHLKIDYLKVLAVLVADFHQGNFKLEYFEKALDSAK